MVVLLVPILFYLTHMQAHPHKQDNTKIPTTNPTTQATVWSSESVTSVVVLRHGSSGVHIPSELQ